MKRRRFLESGLALALPVRGVAAQNSTNPARLGWITAQTEASLTPYLAGFRAALAELGYVEGRNLTIAFRFGDDSISRIPELAAELERLPVDVIVAQGIAVSVVNTLKLSRPVAYIYSGDPVLAGFADSLARPHANMTGLTFMAAEFNAKRLEMLREIMPKLRRVAIIGDPQHPGAETERANSEETGRRLGLAIRYFPTRNRDELNDAFARLTAEPTEAISLFADGFAVAHRESVIEFATRMRAPVVSGWPLFAESGAVLTYGPRLIESYRRLAYYVDRILKGAKPDSLPIERPTQFELVVNNKAARTLGLTIPQSLLLRADTVIG